MYIQESKVFPNVVVELDPYYTGKVNLIGITAILGKQNFGFDIINPLDKIFTKIVMGIDNYVTVILHQH